MNQYGGRRYESIFLWVVFSVSGRRGNGCGHSGCAFIPGEAVLLDPGNHAGSKSVPGVSGLGLSNRQEKRNYTDWKKLVFTNRNFDGIYGKRAGKQRF